MNSLFTLGEEFGFIAPADSVRRLEMQNFRFTTERKEFQICDSRRLRKKAQDTQDAVLSFSFSRADNAFEILEVFEGFRLLCNLQPAPRTREAPTVSPKSLLISGAKNKPSGQGEVQGWA